MLKTKIFESQIITNTPVQIQHMTFWFTTSDFSFGIFKSVLNYSYHIKHGWNLPSMLIYWMFVIYVDRKFKMSPISWKRFSKGTKGITNIFFSEIIDLSESKLCIHIHWIKPLSILHFFCHSEIQLDSTT